MAKKFEKPLADWPKMKILKKEGGVHITGRYAQPGLLKEIYSLYWLVGGGLALFFLVVGPAGLVIGPIIAVGLYWVVWRPLMLSIFRKNVDVKVFPDRIQVKKGLSYKNYARSAPIEFRIEQHQKAHKEAARGSTSTTYRQALEVVMWYGEKRVPLAAFPNEDVQIAQALVFRLQAVINRMDELVRSLGASEAGTADASEFGPAPQVR